MKQGHVRQLYNLGKVHGVDITHDNVCSSMLSCFYSHLLSTGRPISSYYIYFYIILLFPLRATLQIIKFITYNRISKLIFTPQPLRAVGVLFSPMVSGWADIIVLFPLTAILQLINFYSFKLFSLLINAIILLFNCLVLVLCLYIHFLSLI